MMSNLKTFQPSMQKPNTQQSPIEAALTLTLVQRPEHGRTVYRSDNRLWQQPGARGAYGGAVVAQCLMAAQRTTPPDFVAHSINSHFVNTGNVEQPVFYSVETIREGGNFLSRHVQARQGERCILTSVASFMRVRPGSKREVSHGHAMPADLGAPPDEDNISSKRGWLGVQDAPRQPFEIVTCPSWPGGRPEERKMHRWIRAKGPIFSSTSQIHQNMGQQDYQQQSGDRQGVNAINLSALAYMSDHRFIGVVARAHRLTRFADENYISRTIRSTGGSDAERERVRVYLEAIAREEREENGLGDQACDRGFDSTTVGMMVSLDHIIYFHNPQVLRADEWILAEMDSPWAGDSRGLVTQRMWTKDGVLIATCLQEGVVRLAHGGENRAKM